MTPKFNCITVFHFFQSKSPDYFKIFLFFPILHLPPPVFCPADRPAATRSNRGIRFSGCKKGLSPLF